MLHDMASPYLKRCHIYVGLSRVIDGKNVFISSDQNVALEKEMELEDYPQTKEGGVDFVMDIFRSMGGRVIPPRRPGRSTALYLTVARDVSFMDFENACLSRNWDSSKRQHPKGPKRHEDPEWAQMIQSQVYPHHSDVDFQEYCEFCENGGGCEAFQEEEKLG